MTATIDLGHLTDATGDVEPQMCIGVVGGVDKTANYVRLEHGRLLVEVTLQPSGEQVVATVDTGGGECTFYLALSYGCRVVIDWPGASSQAVILARLNDADGEFPTLGVPTALPGRVPLYTALRTGDGQLLLLESGADADVLVYSGGNAQVRVDSSAQVLLSGRTHIGQGAQFTDDPTGACVGDAGSIAPGAGGTPYAPAPAVPMGGPILPVLPPGSVVPVPVPADGIVRVKDPVQSTVLVDPTFWTFLLGFVAIFAAWGAAGVPDPGGIALKAALVAFFSTPVGIPPTSLSSEHRAGSLNTASDS